MPPIEEINNVWATSAAAGQTETLTCPSGQVIKAKRVGLETLVGSGLLGEADTLTEYVDRLMPASAKQRKPVGQVDLSAVMRNPRAMSSMVMLLDRSTPLIVVEPTVMPHFEDMPEGGTRMIPPDKRQDGVVYTDQISLQDKVFIVNFGIQGLTDLGRFREQTDRVVATLADEPSVPRAPQRNAGNRKGRKR